MFDDDGGTGALLAALEGLRGEPVRRLKTERLEDDVLALERSSRVLEAERLRRLAELDRRRSHRRDGHLSTAAWVADRLGASFSVAAQQVRTARALEEMPAVREALGRGDVSASAVRVLVQARQDQPDAFGRSEPLLVDAARALPVSKLQAAVTRWSENTDGRAGEDRARRLRERRRLSISPQVSGMVRLIGELDPETGQTVITAVRAVLDAEARAGGRRDGRSPDQRRADAMREICRRSLDRGDRPDVGGERPHVVVRVDVETLRGGGGVATLEEGGAIPTASARRLLCDASITRVVCAGASEPLDVGRRTPIVRAAIRRAVVTRDGGCRFPGCDRPPAWCDCHHVRHWADGGETALHNLVLLCRPHHELVHERGFRLEGTGDGPAFFRPDGSRLPGRPDGSRLPGRGGRFPAGVA